MKVRDFIKKGGVILTGSALAVLSACAPKPVYTPPPPPPVVRIPPQPVPPMAAAPNLTVPPLAADGSRVTVNYGVNTDQATWNLRSAYNVAALNCQSAEHAALVARYGEFLKTHSRSLKTVNTALDSKFRKEHGSGYIRVRETYQTQVYNYFALPPVLPAFCDAALAMSAELQNVAPGGLEAYAPLGLAKLESVFSEFYNSYEQYQRDLAAWKARYEPTPANIEAAPLQSGLDQGAGAPRAY